MKVENDKVAGEISSDAVPMQPIRTLQGRQDAAARLFVQLGREPGGGGRLTTPAEEGKLNAQIDFAGGAYVMTGTATKNEKEKEKKKEK